MPLRRAPLSVETATHPRTQFRTVMSPSLPSIFVALALSLILAPTSLAQRKTLPYNFTLAAVNTTLPNANDTGVPLVLGLECMMTDREQTTAPADRPLVVFDYSAIYWTSVRSEPFLADLCTMLC